ncbi:MAG: hypothetical protein HQL66_04385 [Magnetococcales bacterium]|nr:hypothetical protein [Magnetococcales bacterium]
MGVPQYAPDITEEEKAMVARFSKLAEEMIAKRNGHPPTRYFKDDPHAGDGVVIWDPSEPRPEFLYDQMRRTGEIPY